MKSKRKQNSFRLIYLILLAVLVLLNNESTRLVNGQLEAVGAVLSVVPVTSILATAGLVGVKLAALSRLLKVLGYDQAYLANIGGHGTAAAPIGLQTNYAYMFPYVPGLNISVKGESGTNYENLAQHQREAAQTSVTRKTFPAMALPGDYESQNRPFRGSESLRDIFKDAGVQVKFPTLQQQQSFNGGFPKGNGNSNSNIDPSGSNNDFDNVQPSATTPIYRPTNENLNNINNNNNQPSNLQPNLQSNLQPNMQPILQPNLQPNPQPNLQPPYQQPNTNPQSNQPVPIDVPLSSSNSLINPVLPSEPNPPDNMGWPTRQSSNQNQQPANHPPSSSNFPIPVQPDQHHHQPAPIPAERPHHQQQPPQPQSPPSHPSSQSSQVSNSLFHPVPQHVYFNHDTLERSRPGPIKPEPLPSGSLIRVPERVPTQPQPQPQPHSPPSQPQLQPQPQPTSFEDYERQIFGSGGTSNNLSGGLTVMNGSDHGLSPADITTNIVPLPYSTEGPPPFHDDMHHNELLRVFRRKRRDVLNQLGREAPATSLGDKILAAGMQHPVDQPRDTFGMPAVNINPMRRRRRKRSLTMKILSASNLLARA